MVALQAKNRSPSYGNFNLLQKIRDFVILSGWINQQMYMLGHEDIRPKAVVQFVAGSTHGAGKPAAASLAAKEWLTSIARKCEEMRMSGLVPRHAIPVIKQTVADLNFHDPIVWSGFAKIKCGGCHGGVPRICCRSQIRARLQ